MKQNKINDLKKLTIENFENIFNIHTDENNRYFYNLLQSITIPSNLPNGYYVKYTTKPGETWPLISYRNYNTPNLWWLILCVNNINNPVIQPESGTTLKVIRMEYAKAILAEIQNLIK